jgi:hypothetical protein
MAKTKHADEVEVEERSAEVEPRSNPINPNYSYGAPTTVTGQNPSPANTAGATTVTIAGGQNMVASPPGTIVSVPGGSPSDELVAMLTPTLASISPTTVVHGVASALVTCTGTGFLATTVVTNNGVVMATNYVSATSVTYTMPHLTAPIGTVSVNVQNSGIASTTPRTFTYT